ncbi:hypothetical protein HanPI659440_Chr14g0541341 [Helianthus annuus]|nr:hypothetical protein HanPI659440_Chr14g0541341 [Helianthus annuus]
MAVFYSSGNSKDGKQVIHLVALATLWSVWLARNELVFNRRVLNDVDRIKGRYFIILPATCILCGRDYEQTLGSHSKQQAYHDVARCCASIIKKAALIGFK